MPTSATMEERIRGVIARDPRYAPEAYRFTLEALSYTQEQFRKQGHHGHVDGRELLWGIRSYASGLFGFLARAVFAEWGVRTTGDFGEIVFNLIEARLLSKQETDKKTDFQDVYDFEEAFESTFVHPSA